MKMVQNGLSNFGTQFLKNEIEYQKNKVRFSDLISAKTCWKIKVWSKTWSKNNYSKDYIIDL